LTFPSASAFSDNYIRVTVVDIGHGPGHKLYRIHTTLDFLLVFGKRQETHTPYGFLHNKLLEFIIMNLLS
jgi:hypothetical protein